MKIKIRKPSIRFKSGSFGFSSLIWNSKNLLFPVLMLVYQILAALYDEKLPENNGLGWDGQAYGDMAMMGLKSWWLNDFFALRMFPSILVNVALKLLGFANNFENIVLGFGILNAVCISLALFFLLKIFDLLNFKPATQALGLLVVFFNYGILKFVVFYPVMTDAVALLISTMMVFCYLKKHHIELVILALFGAYTTPLLILLAGPLLLFPYQAESYEAPLEDKGKKLLWLGAATYFLAISFYVSFVVEYWLNIPMVLQPKEGFLIPGIFASAILFAGIAALLGNQNFLKIDWIKSRFTRTGLISLVAFIGLFILSRNMVQTNAPSPYPASFFFYSHHTTCTYMRPLIGIAGQFNFFGILVILMILTWSVFIQKIQQLGFGIHVALTGCLLAFGMTCEARTLYALLPLAALPMLMAINDRKLGNLFFLLVLLVNFGTGKLWLRINYQWGNGWDESGAANFPNQWFFMHLGPWMSHNVWQFLLISATITGTIFYFLFFRNTFKLPFLNRKQPEDVLS